jgi:accessory gene regulator protein AgrB
MRDDMSEEEFIKKLKKEVNMDKIKFFKITFGLFVFMSVLSIYMAVTV